ncbi:M16 family metallopeptidase [Blattabacterium cuenoti]|uniref:M16 family metallopeptidase n=1 Tax=Blattabacterium cuenoti TaxID=1653831 RepID=UPI00163C7114|nr:pitrilysin family protein [Blattabacterium cuenoti]
MTKINRKIPPKPLTNQVVPNIKKPLLFKMNNGLTVLLTENYKFPIIRVHFVLNYPIFLEKEKAGIKKVFGNMLRSGTKNFSKEEIDQKIDYMGSKLFTSFSNISLFSLQKYFEESFFIFSDILINSQFDNIIEFNKIIKQKIIDIDISEKDPNAILERVKNVLYFGINHPYGEYETYKTIQNITLLDLKQLYNQYYCPSISYISFIGSISMKQVMSLCHKYLLKWNKKHIHIIENKINQKFIQKKLEISIVDLPTLTQSFICFGHPVFFKKSDSIYFSALLANGILGVGAQSRLFLKIREKSAYTYGIYSILKPDKYIGYFSIYTQVRNDVTDKAIKDILKTIKEMKDNISNEELDIKKEEICGQFILNLEDPSKINDLFISELKDNLQVGFYEKYLNHIKNVNIYDVYQICKNFFSTTTGQMIIVGNSKKIFNKIQKIGYSIYFFDKFGNKLK